ncbi:hypothetical protein DFJ74DRAFT_773803 [Hyaloraphidium curvatum]|nr:hypothetical protein DFJ74DRAFT_773803 [Hyaloraphidium curvatum]
MSRPVGGPPRRPRRACSECARRKHACVGGVPGPGEGGGPASLACSGCELRGSLCEFPAVVAGAAVPRALTPTPPAAGSSQMLVFPVLISLPGISPSPFGGEVEPPTVASLAAQLGSLNAAVGRVAPLPRSAIVGDVSSPLLWAALWGMAVADGLPGDSSVIGVRARELLLAALERTCAELAPHSEDGDAPRSAAGPAVTVLHALLLTMLGAELAGSQRAMVGLASLAVRFAHLAAVSLRGWIIRTCSFLAEDRTLVEAGDPDIDAMEAWIARRGFSAIGPAAESLCYSLPRPATLGSLPSEDRSDMVLLSRFAACFFYCTATEMWSAELVDPTAMCTRPDVAHVPVPFDAKHLGDGSFDGRPPVYLNPVVSIGSFSTWCQPATNAAARSLILRATITDAFRVGTHFLFTVHHDVLSLTAALRERARAAGYGRLYPDACLADPGVRAEMERLRALLDEAYAALPPEMLEMAEQGRVAELLEAHQTGPVFAESPPIAAWMIFYFEYQATLFAPSPDAEPPRGWQAHCDGIRSGAAAVLAARFLRGLLDAGQDPNSRDLPRWTHTRVDRVARVLALHRAAAAATGLPTEALFAEALGSCIAWFARVGAGERAGEWVRRLADGGLIEPVGEGMALAEQDKALARFRGAMESIEGALDVLLDYGP